MNRAARQRVFIQAQEHIASALELLQDLRAGGSASLGHVDFMLANRGVNSLERLSSAIEKRITKRKGGA